MPAALLTSDEPARLVALHSYDVLDTPPSQVFDELAALAARICGAPVALISLVDRDRQWFKARFGLDLREAPRAHSFCAHALSPASGLLLVPDARRDPRFGENPWVSGDPAIRFYAGTPLVTPDGHTLGTLCVLDRQPRELTPEQTDALQVLGRQVMAQLELHRSGRETRQIRARLANSQRIALLGDWDHNLVEDRLLWSDEIYRLLGLRPEETRPDSAEFYRQVHPDDAAYVQAQKLLAAIGTRRVEFDHRLIGAEGQVRYVHQIVERLFDHQGKATHEAGTLQDVTERRCAEADLRQSEERYRALLMGSPDPQFVHLDGVIMLVNSAFCRLMGESRPADLIGRRALDVVHPNNHPKLQEPRQPPPEEGVPAAVEMRFIRLDGSLVPVEVSTTGFDLQGRHEVQVIARDLTVRKELESQYLRAQRMESIGTLAGGIAHDLNNVLAPIMISIELLQQDLKNDPADAQLLEVIQVSSRRGADLVRQVLLFGRGLDTQSTALALPPLIAELETIITQTFPRSIRIAKHLAADLWPIMGNSTQLQQVLLNLAVNARDAMPKGGVLTFQAANLSLAAPPGLGVSSPTPAEYVRLTITDTGIGIPRAVRDKIFEAFFSTKRAGEGTGLGLSTVQAIVKGHGGFITVESEVGQGASFCVHLPAYHGSAPALVASGTAAPAPRGQGELILVVDDESSLRYITQQTLEAHGYRILTASDGAAGLSAYREHFREIAVVLTDMMMPVMDGGAMISAMIELNPAVRIITTSGLNSASDTQRARRLGVKHFLPKPYTAQNLRQLIHDVLQT